MHATSTYQNGGSKATKIAIVTALHLGVALALLNMKVITPPAAPIPVKPITEKKVVVTPPPKLEPIEKPKDVIPPIFVPENKIVETEPPPDTVIAKKLPPGPPPELVKSGAGPGAVEGEKVLVKAPDVHKPFVPNAADCARPDYPARAARNGDAGTVTLSLLINANGKVVDSKINRTSGFKDLDRAAVEALSMCKFKPASTNGVPEAAWGQLAYVWTLD